MKYVQQNDMSKQSLKEIQDLKLQASYAIA